MDPQTITLPSTPAPNPQPTQSPTVYKSGLYWRKVFISFLCPPGILSLESGQLKFKTKDAVIFEAPLTQCSFHFTSFGEMKVTVAGKHYDFLGTPGALAQSFDKSLLDELHQPTDSRAALTNAGDAMVGAGIVGAHTTTGPLSTASEAVEGVGVALIVAKSYQSLGVVGDWQPVLRAQNATITGKVMKPWVFVLIGIGALILICVVIFGILPALDPACRNGGAC
jgi:hypothetical protein